VHNKEVIMVQDMLLPLVRLNRVLGVPGEEGTARKLTIAVIQKGEKYTGFLVDSLVGQQEIVIKSIGKYLAGTKYVSGATILGDGSVAMIIDVNSLAR